MFPQSASGATTMKDMTLPEPTMAQALQRGAMCRCPNCGEGPLFRSFLKVNEHCPACGEAYHHHRADDLPAYIVMLIVGHVVVTFLMVTEAAYAPAFWIHALLWFPMTIGLSLGLLQPVKGAVVALQWKLRMHGFGSRRGLTEKAAAPHTSA
jgi:uncharacterized protein (DUF983 family)